MDSIKYDLSRNCQTEKYCSRYDMISDAHTTLMSLARGAEVVTVVVLEQRPDLVTGKAPMIK